jgi:hypothetical protein
MAGQANSVEDNPSDRSAQQDQGQPLSRPDIVTLDQVEAERVSWLWHGRIPLGKLSLLVGDPEAGKSTIALDVAARVTTGTPFPDDAPCERGDVLFCTLEDGLADTIRPRLDAAGADCSRVHSIRAIVTESRDELIETDQGPRWTTTRTGERGLQLPEDLRFYLTDVVKARGIRLVVFDPIKGYMGTGINEWRDGDVRRVLGPLSHWAEEHDVATLGIAHLTKASQAATQYRVSGSIAFTAAARAVLVAAPDPADPDGGDRLFAALKTSLSRRPPTLKYRLEAPDGTDDGPAAVVWRGESAVTARQALAAPVTDEERSAGERAREVLLDALNGVPRPQREVVREVCQAADVSDSVVRRVAREVGVISKRTGFGPGAVYTWTLDAPHAGHTHVSDQHGEREVGNSAPNNEIAHAAHAGHAHAGQPPLTSMERESLELDL